MENYRKSLVHLLLVMTLLAFAGRSLVPPGFMLQLNSDFIQLRIVLCPFQNAAITSDDWRKHYRSEHLNSVTTDKKPHEDNFSESCPFEATLLKFTAPAQLDDELIVLLQQTIFMPIQSMVSVPITLSPIQARAPPDNPSAKSI